MQAALAEWSYGDWHVDEVRWDADAGVLEGQLMRSDTPHTGWYMQRALRQPMHDLARELTHVAKRQVYFDLVDGRVRVFLGTGA
jgi:hypothetical protein